MRAGRLIRQAQAGDAARPCACGHGCHRHTEWPYEPRHPSYAPLVFHCLDCPAYPGNKVAETA